VHELRTDVRIMLARHRLTQISPPDRVPEENMKSPMSLSAHQKCLLDELAGLIHLCAEGPSRQEEVQGRGDGCVICEQNP